VRFFYFYNAPTFHFFQWICHSGQVDPDKLVADALAQVEGDEGFKLGTDVSTEAQGKLAELLEEVLEEQANEQLPAFENVVGDDVIGVGRFEADGGGYQWPGALFAPLLAEALAGIHFDVVAQALLIRSGKWEPKLDIPEAL
jgi:hypothetical protein